MRNSANGPAARLFSAIMATAPAHRTPLTEDSHPDLPHCCIAFDSLVRADVELPGAAFQPRRPPAREIRVRRGQLSRLVKGLDRKLVSTTNLSRDFLLRTGRGHPIGGAVRTWALEASGAVTFLWREGSAEVLYEPGPEYGTELFGFLLLHSFLPVYFTVNRTYRVLHAGAIRLDGQALVLLAPGMGGKSTLTDYFVSRGHALVSDDKLATRELDGTYLAVGSYPYRRPWREAEVLGDYTANFASAPRPIRAIFLLIRAAARQPAQTVEAIRGTDRFRHLAAGQDVLLPYRKAADFEYFAGMADRLPVFEVHMPWDLRRLEEVYDEVRGALERSAP